MAKFDKIKIPSAVTRRSKFDLSHDHITTLNFGVLQPVAYRHMIKNETLDMNVLATVRPYPLVVPTYGRMRMLIRSFFVPYSQVFPLWNEFYTDVIASSQGDSSLVSNPPIISNSVFIKYFIDDQLNYLCNPASQGSTFDFTYYDSNVGSVRYVFTPTGRMVIKVLHSLGYRFSWNGDDTTNYNALGLLCWAKVYVDWYANQNYLNSVEFLRVKQLFEYRTTTTPLSLRPADLNNILLFCNLSSYESDTYFNAAWDNPSGPNSGQSSLFEFDDLTQSSSPSHTRVGTQSNGTPAMYQYPNGNTNQIGTQYIHDVLQRLTDYQKRHQLTSALPISRWLAQWGDSVPSLENNRSIYIGCKSVDVNVGEIMSTAATVDASLGDYAGRSFGQGDAGFKFTADEFGMLITICTIHPTGTLYQGVDRNNLSLTKAEFFQPEFDGLSVQAIARREVLVPQTTPGVAQSQMDGVFGWTGRYGHYKRPLSYVTGDIALPSGMIGGSSWHLNRILESTMQENFDYSVIGHSENFVKVSDFNSYHRIFNAKIVNADCFFGCFHFTIGVTAPARPLFDTYEFADKGKEITAETGAFVN